MSRPVEPCEVGELGAAVIGTRGGATTWQALWSCPAVQRLVPLHTPRCKVLP
jgi:hypothetical protein